MLDSYLFRVHRQAIKYMEQEIFIPEEKLYDYRRKDKDIYPFLFRHGVTVPYYNVSEGLLYFMNGDPVHRWILDRMGKKIGDHFELPQEVLQELLNACNEVLRNCILRYGTGVGFDLTITPGGGQSLYPFGYTEAPGFLLVDPGVVEQWFPAYIRDSGVDEYVIRTVGLVRDAVVKALSSNFSTHAIYYYSW